MTFPVVKIPKIPRIKGINISEDILPMKNPAETTKRHRTEIMNLVDCMFEFIFCFKLIINYIIF